MEGVRSVQPSIMDGPAVDTLQPAQVPEVEDGGEGHRAEVHAWNSTVRGAGVVNAGSGGGASLRRRVTGPLPREVGIPVRGGTGRVRPGTRREEVGQPVRRVVVPADLVPVRLVPEVLRVELRC